MSVATQIAVLSISAAAVGYTLMPTVQAAVHLGPGALNHQTTIVQVQKKPKGQATCGTYKYWSAKERKCLDARDKKTKQ